MATFNEITGVRAGQDKSGNNFKTFNVTCTSFNTMKHPVTGQEINALGSATRQTLNAWETSAVESPYNHLYNATEGTAVIGNLETREVEAYQIEDNIAGETVLRTVNTYTCFVAEDVNSPRYESAVRSAFRWNGHPLTNTTSEDTVAVSDMNVEVDFGA